MKPKAQMVEFNPAVHQIPSSWYGSRIDNEVLDFCITLIPDDFDRMVFTMFVLDGFDYTECSKATGIPKQSLQEAVQRSRKFLRRFVRKK
jgi:DNA-directed RNA polymerase specialized sigma24 family protein